MLICALGILTHSYQLNVTFAISCTISLFFLFSFFFLAGAPHSNIIHTISHVF